MEAIYNEFFVEQYHNKTTKQDILSQVLPIDCLSTTLQATRYYPSLYTVCIFKIKLKKQL